MKRILYSLCIPLLFYSFTVLQAGKEEMITALKTANAGEFVKYFDNNIDVKLPNSDEMKSVPKAQAAATVKSFFTNSNISSCTITSQRENAGTMYITGKLNGSSNYNVTAMIKSNGDKFSIITLRVNN